MPKIEPGILHELKAALLPMLQSIPKPIRTGAMYGGLGAAGYGVGSGDSLSEIARKGALGAMGGGAIGAVGPIRRAIMTDPGRQLVPSGARLALAAGIGGGLGIPIVQDALKENRDGEEEPEYNYSGLAS